jgi:membrane fusion protein (multidrug efflux system)
MRLVSSPCYSGLRRWCGPCSQSCNSVRACTAEPGYPACASIAGAWLELVVMRFDERLWAAVALSAVLLSTACRGSDAVDAAPPQERRPVAVTVANVAAEQAPVTLEATGGFQPQESSDVAPEASGRVVATPVEVGQFVNAGQVLVRLQGVDADLRLDEARAAVTKAEAAIKLAESQNALAQTTAQRYNALLATGDVSRTVADQARTAAETSQQDVNTARASLLQAQAQLAQAEKAARDVVVAAPFRGFVSERRVSLGEYVQPSTPVVTLVQIDPLRLQLTIPAVQAGQVQRGQAVTARVDAYPDRTFDGEITSVNPSISPESRSFVVEARVRNPERLLKPGMFATASISQGRTEQVILVPRAAVVEDVNTNSFRVFVVDDQQRARLRVVQLAPRQAGDRVRILSGLEAGQRVATSNLGPLYDTAPVTIASARSAETATQ